MAYFLIKRVILSSLNNARKCEKNVLINLVEYTCNKIKLLSRSKVVTKNSFKFLKCWKNCKFTIIFSRNNREELIFVKNIYFTVKLSVCKRYIFRKSHLRPCVH